MAFKMGDKVRINELSVFYDRGINNPMKTTGTIIDIHDDHSLPYRVDWGDGRKNTYATTDLIHLAEYIDSSVPDKVKQGITLEELKKLVKHGDVIIESTGMWKLDLKYLRVTKDLYVFNNPVDGDICPLLDKLQFKQKLGQIGNRLDDGYRFVQYVDQEKFLEPEEPKKASDTQVGGEHYKTAIQPIEYIHANKLTYFEGNVIKYVTRHASKNGKQDLLKAKHYIDFILQFEYPEED